MSQSISQIKNKETHTLVLGSSEDGSIRTFTFIEHSVSQKGWAKLRLVRLEDSIQIPGLPLVTEYDPAVHDGASHYMSFLWPARSIKRGGELFSVRGIWRTGTEAKPRTCECTSTRESLLGPLYPSNPKQTNSRLVLWYWL